MIPLKSKRPERVRWVRASYFIFLVVPVGLWLAYQAYGLPHVIWSYSWIDQGQGYGPLKQRHYTRCTYLGPYGAVTERHPLTGKCKWFVMRKEQGKKR